MTREEFLNNYWRYYLILEQKMMNSLQFVELDVDNFYAFSMEFITQIQNLGSEVDTIMKVIAGFQLSSRKTITDYASTILVKYPSITQQEVKIQNNSLIIKPFKNWNTNQPSKSLVWWENYNEIKHGRTQNMKKANLNTTLHLLGALYILEIYLLKEIADTYNDVDIPDSESKLFIMMNWNYKNMSMAGMICEVYEGNPVIGGGTF